LTGINLVISPGQFTTILGPSGCGKSTLLDLVGGLKAPSEGEVLVGGRPASARAARCAMVFQQPGLFPWLTALQNVTVGPRNAGVAKAEAEARGRELLAMAGVERAADRRPHELSGGMAQRVGLVRALAMDPDVLLMDEPFAAVDAQTRARLQEELLEMTSARQCSVVFVTHDVREAVLLGQRVVVLSSGPGRIVANELVEPDQHDVDSPRAIELCRELTGLLLPERVR
jgi:ABC-type nitrate/sulfonate/bicarbonate transport system ATPase subunit